MNSASKFKRVLEAACRTTSSRDGRLRYTMQYAGAGRTGRWAGRMFQPHNLIRPTIEDAEYIEEIVVPGILTGDVLDPEQEFLYGSPQEACANALRGVICAPEGKTFVAADWSSIEGRVLAWMAGEQWVLDAYAAGKDMYRMTYCRAFGGEPEAISKADRFVGKILDLSMGYEGGVGALVTMGAAFSADLGMIAERALERADDDMLASADWMWEWAGREGSTWGLDERTYRGLDCSKQAYRRSRPATAGLWKDVGSAAVYAIENPGTVMQAARCKIWRNGGWLIVELPSGRRLMYCQPEVRRDKNDRASITFMSARGKQWRRIGTYGGKLVENITQAIANDILRHALLKVDRLRRDCIVLHVHDEIVTEVPESVAHKWYDQMVNAMCEPPEWAEGLPLAAAGYVGRRFRK
jgi:DNA polymerase